MGSGYSLGFRELIPREFGVSELFKFAVSFPVSCTVVARGKEYFKAPLNNTELNCRAPSHMKDLQLLLMTL